VRRGPSEPNHERWQLHQLVREALDEVAGAPQPAPTILPDEANGHVQAKFHGVNNREGRVSVSAIGLVSSVWFSNTSRTYDARHQEKVTEGGARDLGARIAAFLSGDDAAAQRQP
jgi:hypothetical protein